MTLSLVRYQPLTQLMREVDRLFDERFFVPYRLYALKPGIDMYHTDNAVVVKAEMAGVKPKQIKVKAKTRKAARSKAKKPS